MKQQTFHYSDRIAINYRAMGHGPAPLILLHGFAAALTTWDDLAPLFPKDRYTLYLVDMKGFGHSSAPRDGRYHLEDQAAIITAFIAAMDLLNPVLAGHSLGGGIALLALLQSMAESRPHTIAAMILIDCAAYPQPLPRFFRLLLIPFLNRLFLSLIPPAVIVRRTLSRVYHDPATMTPERIARYLPVFSRRTSASVFIRTVRQLHPGAHEEQTRRYPEITIPVLIVWGERDRIIRLSFGKRLAKAIPGARFVVIPACGHNPHEERPQDTFTAISAFLDSLPENTGG